MTPRLLSDIARMTGGRLVGADRTVDAIATDTRALPQGGAALRPGPSPVRGSTAAVHRDETQG